jgi:hypothetical protein
VNRRVTAEHFLCHWANLWRFMALSRYPGLDAGSASIRGTNCVQSVASWARNWRGGLALMPQATAGRRGSFVRLPEVMYGGPTSAATQED